MAAPTSLNIKRILIVDDDKVITSTISTNLNQQGYEASSTNSVAEAKQWLAKSPLAPDIVILDYNMPGEPGLSLCSQLNQNSVPFILLTAYSDDQIIKEATQYGAIAYLVKPVSNNQLVAAIETAIHKSQKIAHLEYSVDQLQHILEQKRVISMACGMLALHLGTTTENAETALRKMARNNNLKLVDVAENVCSSVALLASFKSLL